MQTVLLVATVAAVVVNLAEVVAKALRVPFVVRNAGEVGLAPRWIPYLAVLEGAGAVGLAVGLLGVPVLGLAAAVGLVAFFVGAVLAHLRTRVLHNIAFPAGFLVLALAALGYFA